MYRTCVITDICCRLVSTILNTLVLMITKCYIHIPPPHTHMSTPTTMCTQDGFSPLYTASQEGHDRIVEMLLQAGATVDLQTKVENCYYLFICHFWCAMCTIHCTLSTTQQSGEYEGQRTYPTHSRWLCEWENKIIRALKACTCSGLGMCFWTESASLSSKFQFLATRCAPVCKHGH